MLYACLVLQHTASSPSHWTRVHDASIHSKSPTTQHQYMLLLSLQAPRCVCTPSCYEPIETRSLSTDEETYDIASQRRSSWKLCTSFYSSFFARRPPSSSSCLHLLTASKTMWTSDGWIPQVPTHVIHTVTVSMLVQGHLCFTSFNIPTLPYAADSLSKNGGVEAKPEPN